MKKDEILLLENQLCFPFYAISNAITRSYGPLLKELNLTYPQYLVLLLLWEREGRSVTDICNSLFLKTNTLTPLLKKLEQKNLVVKRKDHLDVRKVLVFLSEEGKFLKEKAECIPQQLIETTNMKVEDMKKLRSLLNKMMADITQNSTKDGSS